MIQFGLSLGTIKTNFKLNILKTSRISITDYNNNIISISPMTVTFKYVVIDLLLCKLSRATPVSKRLTSTNNKMKEVCCKVSYGIHAANIIQLVE